MTELYNRTINEIETPASYSLILTLVWLINQEYAIKTRAPVIIGQYAQNREAQQEHSDLVNEVLKRISSVADIKYLVETDSTDCELNDFGASLSDEDYFYHLYVNKDKAIWFIDGFESFKYLETDLVSKRKHYNRNGFFCIVLTGRVANRFEQVHRIFHRLFDIYVINVNLLLMDDETTYAYTYFPYKHQECHQTSPQLVGSLGPTSNFKFTHSYFFPKKLSNMWGCNLTVTTWTEPPFMIIEKNEIKGIEGRLLVELSKQMNFTIDVKPPPRNDRGTVYPNKTATGALKMLIERETNITIISLMYDSNRLQYAEGAYTYFSAPLVVGHSKGRRMSPFERLLRPFKYIIWSCLSSSLLIAVLLIFLIKYYFKPETQSFIFGPRNRTPFTNLWNALYGGSLHGVNVPRRNFARYILAVWILYTLILRTAYIGQLFQTLQDARARSNLKTLDEVMRNNYTFFTFPVLVPILFDPKKRPGIICFVDSAENSLPNLFRRLGRDETKFVVTVLSQFIHNYNQQPENRLYQVSILPEPILNAPITFFMPKHTYLSYEINDLLLRIMSAGLISRFEELSLGSSSMWNKRTQQQALLSLWVVLGIFVLYLVLLALCFLVFLLELSSTRSLIGRRVIEFFNC